MSKVIEGYKIEGYAKQNYGYMHLYDNPEEQKKELQSFIRESEDHLNANNSRVYSSVHLEIVPEYDYDTVREELVKKLADHFGFNGVDGTYTYILTRVKEAFGYGTMTLDDFQEMNDDDLYTLADFILDFMKFR